MELQSHVLGGKLDRKEFKILSTLRACVPVIHFVILNHKDESFAHHIFVYFLPSARHRSGCREQSREQDRRATRVHRASVLEKVQAASDGGD